MPYPDTVAALAKELGLINPLREEDIKIEALVIAEVEPGMRTVSVKGTDKNLGGRLFYQHHASDEKGNRADEIDLTTEFKQAAAEFFAPIWDDGQERRLLDATRLGKRAIIIWKDQMK